MRPLCALLYANVETDKHNEDGRHRKEYGAKGAVRMPVPDALIMPVLPQHSATYHIISLGRLKMCDHRLAWVGGIGAVHALSNLTRLMCGEHYVVERRKVINPGPRRTWG